MAPPVLRTPAPRALGACLALALGLPAAALADRGAGAPVDASASLPRADALYARRLELRRQRDAGPRAAREGSPTRPGATLPVTSCADDGGAGTLRSVIAGAAEGDTIDM